MQVLNASEMETGYMSALIYAPPGTGKTTLLGTLPGKTLILDVDRGAAVLKGLSNVDIISVSEDLRELRECLEWVKDKKYDNICVDSLSELERGMLTAYGREGGNDGAPEQGHYLRMQYKMMDYCRQFRALPANVIFTAWETQEEIISKTGTKRTRARPLINGKICDAICGLCDVVGNITISAKEETEGKRFVLLTGTTNAIAKDRLRKRQYCGFEELIQNV